MQRSELALKTISKISLILCIIGGINWGFIGLFQFDIVAWVFGGQDSLISRVIYFVIGLAAIWAISLLLVHFDEPKIPEMPENDVPDIGIS